MIVANYKQKVMIREVSSSSSEYISFPKHAFRVIRLTQLIRYFHARTFLPTVPPDILDYDTSTDMVVMEGRNVTLRCAATGSPAPNITWRREDGQQIQLGNGEESEF